MKRLLLAASATVLASAPCAEAQALDVFRTHEEISAMLATTLAQNTSCHLLSDAHPLELDDAILRAICSNPQARRALAETRLRAAELGVASAAYLPTLNATAGIKHNTLDTAYDIDDRGSFSESQSTSSKHGVLDLSWVLFDFGKRGAARRQASALLSAAIAIQDDTLQAVLVNAAEAFYALRASQASLDAAQRTEAIAHESLAEATAKHAAGAGTLADELQARTSYRRAVLDRVSAEGDARSATGALAVTLGLDANIDIRIAPEEHDAYADTSDSIEAGIDQLIEEAKQHRPKLVAARAKLDAVRANVDAARAQVRPTISLIGSLTQNNPSYHQQPQSIPNARTRGIMLGVQVTIPLFEGFASSYRVEQAQARADAQEATLHDTELQVSLDVWKSYHASRTDAANLANSRDLLHDAQHALDIARGRYKEGVGTFAEMLSAQTALADAHKQRVLAISKWRIARLRLAASLGKLGFSSARP